MKIIFELPRYSQVSGGIAITVELAKRLGAELRFQEPVGVDIGVKYTFGPTKGFPPCDVAITYSDTPHIIDFRKVKSKKKLIFMQSFGMSIATERLNVSCVRPFTVSEKVSSLIESTGIKCTNIGMPIESESWKYTASKRLNYLAILYHNSGLKRYDLAVDIANWLYINNVIDGVITFGGEGGYEKHKHPTGLIEHYKNASKEQVMELFNNCKAFLMPSISEGFNLCPVESTLCGCPAVICDGDTIFKHEINCFKVNPDDRYTLYNTVSYVVREYYNIHNSFRLMMLNKIKDMTWEKTINNFQLLCLEK